MSFAVWARAMTVSSKSTRCRDAISLLAIAYAVQALTAPKAQRSMHGHLHVPGDRVAGHAQVMLQRRFGRVLDDQRGVASYAVAISAAAIDDATPISAWQPPSAADSVAWCLQR